MFKFLHPHPSASFEIEALQPTPSARLALHLAKPILPGRAIGPRYLAARHAKSTAAAPRVAAITDVTSPPPSVSSRAM